VSADSDNTSSKTQIALDYAYSRHKSDGPDACAVFWVHAESQATFAHDYGRIGAKLGVNSTLKGQELYRAVSHAIEAQPSWVLVIDNADHLGMFGMPPPGSRATTDTSIVNLRENLPRGRNGTVLWTSRDGRISELVGPGLAINVGSMKASEGSSLLSTELPASSAAGDAEDFGGDDSQRLLEELEYLPLAISQAAAYIRHTRIDTREYLSLLREQQQQRWNILAESQHDRYRKGTLPNSVLGAWTVSVNQLQLENPTAYRILCVIAFVDNQNIPLDILSAASGLDADRRVLVSQAVARLQDFSFIGKSRTAQGEGRYEMHKLVQEVTQYHLRRQRSGSPENNTPWTVHSNKFIRSRDDCAVKPEDDFFFAHETLKIMTNLFPYSDVGSGREVWDRCEVLLAHALSIANAVETTYEKLRPNTDCLLQNLWMFLGMQSRYREQEIMAERLLAVHRETLGNNHTKTLRAMWALAQVLRNQGRYDQAMMLMPEAVQRQCRAFGERHLESLKMRTELAMLYDDSGRYVEAREIVEDVLRVQRETYGDKSELTTIALTILSRISRKQGRMADAVELQAMALETNRILHGDRHRRTMDSMFNLGTLYRLQHRYAEAESLIQAAQSGYGDLFGESHADSVKIRMELGLVYLDQRRFDMAEEAFTKAFETTKEVLGAIHPLTLSAMRCAAHARINLDPSEGETRILEVLELHRKVRGEEHPDTLECRLPNIVLGDPFAKELLERVGGRLGLFRDDSHGGQSKGSRQTFDAGRAVMCLALRVG